MQQPSYYAIIPARVRYDQTVPDGAKLLYGEITALSDQHGYCWATNKYFAALYGKSSDTISRWMSALGRAGHINYIVDSAAGNSRKIWLREQVDYASRKRQPDSPPATPPLSAKMPIPSPQECSEVPAKMPTGTRKNAGTHIGISITKSNTINNDDDGRKTACRKSPKKAPQNSAHTPPPLDIAAESAAMLADDLCRERALRQYGIREGDYAAMVSKFALKIQSEGHTPTSKRDFRAHFFNWAALEAKREAGAPASQSAPRRAHIHNNYNRSDYGAPQKF